MKNLIMGSVLILLTGCLSKQDCWDASQKAEMVLAICGRSYYDDPACKKATDDQVNKALDICHKTGGAF